MTHYSTALHSILISHTIVEIVNGIFWKGSNQPPSGVLATPPPLLQHFPIVIIVMSYVVQQTQVVLIMYCKGLDIVFIVTIMITIVMDTTTVLITPNLSCLCNEVLQETASYMYLTA